MEKIKTGQEYQLVLSTKNAYERKLLHQEAQMLGLTHVTIHHKSQTRSRLNQKARDNINYHVKHRDDSPDYRRRETFRIWQNPNNYESCPIKALWVSSLDYVQNHLYFFPKDICLIILHLLDHKNIPRDFVRVVAK